MMGRGRSMGWDSEGGKEMETKRRTTIYLDDRIMQLVRLEEINLSSLVNEYLSRYLETNGVEAINKKIETVELELKALNDRKKDLLRSSKVETREDQMKNKIWNEFRETYAHRRDLGIQVTQDDQWMTGPRNLQKCSILQLKPVEVLIELKEWYKKKNKRK